MERRIEDGYHVFNWSHSHKPKWPGNQYHTWLKSKNVEYRTEKLKETDHVEYGMPAEYHQTTWCINKAINFIDNCSGHGRPWFFSINIFDPHAPFDPPKSHIDRYLDMLDQIPLPNYSKGELESKPAIQMLEHREGINSSPIKRYRTAEMTESDHKFIKAAYWAMIDLVDEQVGRLYAFLEGKNLLENTLFIFMSDHGELLGDHGMYYKGPFFYEPSVRVPLIVSWPSRIPPGRRSGALVELVDLAPTLLEAAGMPESPGMQGKSFWDLLTGKKEPGFHKKNVYCEYYNSLPWNKPHAYGTMLRDDRNKIVVNHGSDLGELYDLEADPGERTNLWDKAAFKDRKLRMMKDLCDRMAWTADPLPIRDAAF
jgi:arylsulfatase A-like enzyme